MTDAEREMMNTIHLYGLILSLDDSGQEAVKDYISGGGA